MVEVSAALPPSSMDSALPRPNTRLLVVVPGSVNEAGQVQPR